MPSPTALPRSALRPPRPVTDFLANIPLFRELTPADLARIAETTQSISAPRGSVLVSRGEPCTGFHVIVYGQIKLSLQSPDGSQKVVAIMGQGQSFGEAVMFLDEPYLVTAVAIEDSKLLHVARDRVFAELERDPRFARRMLAGLSLRLHQLMIDVESYTLHSASQRVADYLLDGISTAAGVNTASVALRAAKGVIASRLNLTQEHFSRILHQWVSDGVIKVGRRDIQILDVSRLREKLAA